MSASPTGYDLRVSNNRSMLPVAVGIGTMFIAAHTSGVSAMLPVIADQLGSSIMCAQWILIGYTLALSACLLMFGRLGDRIGFRRVYIGGMAVFAFVSLACVFTKTLAALAILRAFQGVGGAMISATSIAILASCVPPSRLGSALGWQAGMTYVGLAFGPLLGDYLTGRFGWRALFVMNVPAALLAVAVMLCVMPKQEAPRLKFWTNAHARKHGVWRFLAGLTWVAGLSALLMAISGRLWLFGLVVVLGLLFVMLDHRSRDPLLPFDLSHNKYFSSAIIGEALHYVCIYAADILMPLYLIRVRGFTGIQIGLILSLQGVARALTAVCSGGLNDRINVCTMKVLGMLVLTVALFSMGGFGHRTSGLQISAALALLGIGTGIFVPANSKGLLCFVPSGLCGRSVGSLGTARNLGMALGIGWATLLYSAFGAGEGVSAAFNGVRAGFFATAFIALFYTVGLLPRLRMAPLSPRFCSINHL